MSDPSNEMRRVDLNEKLPAMNRYKNGRQSDSPPSTTRNQDWDQMASADRKTRPPRSDSPYNNQSQRSLDQLSMNNQPKKQGPASLDGRDRSKKSMEPLQKPTNNQPEKPGPDKSAEPASKVSNEQMKSGSTAPANALSPEQEEYLKKLRAKGAKYV